MPGLSGHEVVLRAGALWPGLPVVMFTSIDGGTSLLDALACGARGYLVKHDPPERMAQLLRLAVEGQLAFSATPQLTLAESLSAQHPQVDGDPLTSRQQEVLRLASQGNSNRDIARATGCETDTVKKHMSAIFDRLDARDRASAVAIAIRAGMI